MTHAIFPIDSVCSVLQLLGVFLVAAAALSQPPPSPLGSRRELSGASYSKWFKAYGAHQNVRWTISRSGAVAGKSVIAPHGGFRGQRCGHDPQDSGESRRRRSVVR